MVISKVKFPRVTNGGRLWLKCAVSYETIPIWYSGYDTLILNVIDPLQPACFTPLCLVLSTCLHSTPIRSYLFITLIYYWSTLLDTSLILSNMINLLKPFLIQYTCSNLPWSFVSDCIISLCSNNSKNPFIYLSLCILIIPPSPSSLFLGYTMDIYAILTLYRGTFCSHHRICK